MAELTEEKIKEQLKKVIDPEIGLSVVDLGLIYDIKVEGDKVHIKMTLTTPGCPLHQMLVRGVERAVAELEGVKDVQVELVWDPPWHPSMMSEEAKKKLGFA